MARDEAISAAGRGDEPARPSASESTPLLVDSLDDDGDGRHGDDVARTAAAVSAVEAEARQMPAMQVALLCLARLVEPVAFFSIFPYINQMVQDNGGLADEDVGFYSGLIESLFSLTQALVMLGWGRASDRFGRKPVLVLSLVCVSAATALFGLARSLPAMIAARCAAGVFSGSLVTLRTMLAEHSTPATQARIFSWFAFSGNVGIFLGPLVGGVLADPLRQHGRPLADDAPLFAVYPYALPGFAVAAIGLASAVTTALFVEETLPAAVRARNRAGAETGADAGAAAAPRPSQRAEIAGLLRAPGVAMVLYVYGHVMLLAFAYTAIMPLFWFTPVALGGFGFTPLQISTMLCVTGAAQAAWLLFAFPALQRRIGTNGVMRLCALMFPGLFAACAAASALLRYPPPAWQPLATRVFWVAAPVLLAAGSGASMCYTAVQLAVNDVAPSPRVLGTLNALALTGVSAIRAVTPALFTSLYAVGARTQWLDGYAIWVLMVALALGYTAAAQHMPDYEALRKQREEEE